MTTTVLMCVGERVRQRERERERESETERERVRQRERERERKTDRETECPGEFSVPGVDCALCSATGGEKAAERGWELVSM